MSVGKGQYNIPDADSVDGVATTPLDGVLRNGLERDEARVDM